MVEDDRVVRHFASSLDITDRVQREQDLREVQAIMNKGGSALRLGRLTFRITLRLPSELPAGLAQCIKSKPGEGAAA
jgi:hypothetical protein